MKNKKQNSIEAPWPEKIPKEAKKILYCMRKIYHLTLDISKLQEWVGGVVWLHKFPNLLDPN